MDIYYEIILDLYQALLYYSPSNKERLIHIVEEIYKRDDFHHKITFQYLQPDLEHLANKIWGYGEEKLENLLANIINNKIKNPDDPTLEIISKYIGKANQ